MFLKIFIFKIAYFLKLSPIFVSSVHNFGKPDNESVYNSVNFIEKSNSLVCDKCGKAFSQKSGLSSHNTFQHPDPNKVMPVKRKRWFSVGTCKYKLGYKSHDLF